MSALQGVALSHLHGRFGVGDSRVNEHSLRLLPGSDVNVSVLTSCANASILAPLGSPRVFLGQNHFCPFLHVGVSEYLLPVITIRDDFQGHIVRPRSTIGIISVAVRAPAF
jgi:hypothetical protein